MCDLTLQMAMLNEDDSYAEACRYAEQQTEYTTSWWCGSGAADVGKHRVHFVCTHRDSVTGENCGKCGEFHEDYEVVRLKPSTQEELCSSITCHLVYMNLI